jgi:cupin fold WbuC family metalloprotein
MATPMIADTTAGTSGTIIRRGDLNEVAEGVFYSSHPLPLVSRDVIEILKTSARENSRRRARFCAHPTPESEQHDMLIVSHRDTYVAPHRHLEKSETFIVLEGKADIMLFDDKGGLEKIVKMGSAASGRPFFYRMPARKFHSLSIESELLVFLESTKGPFRAGESENAPWAPSPTAAAEGRAYIAALLRQGARKGAQN